MAEAVGNAPHGFRRHFRLVYLVLAAALGAAGATVVIVLLQPGYQAPPPWSEWQPAGDLESRVESIRRFVSGHYRLPTDDMLVNVRVTAPTIEGRPVPAYIVSSPTGLGAAVVDAQAGLMYTMCGSGADCSIAGTPSLQRFQVIRREALELALYTLKYIDEVENVLVILPPTFQSSASRPQRRTRAAPTALLFIRDVLKPTLERPLSSTLRRQGLIVVPGPVDPAEGQVVDRITSSFLYRYQPREDANGDTVLYLERAA